MYTKENFVVDAAILNRRNESLAVKRLATTLEGRPTAFLSNAVMGYSVFTDTGDCVSAFMNENGFNIAVIPEVVPLPE